MGSTEVPDVNYCKGYDLQIQYFTNKGFFFKLVALFDSQTLYAKRGAGFSKYRKFEVDCGSLHFRVPKKMWF